MLRQRKIEKIEAKGYKVVFCNGSVFVESRYNSKKFNSVAAAYRYYFS